MSSVEGLRDFVSERITAAAEEISTEFVKTIVQYEEEIDRQRRLLGITSTPQIQSHTTAGDRGESNDTTTINHPEPTSEQLLSSLSPVSESQDQTGSSFMLVQCKFHFEEIFGAQNISERLTAAVEEVFSVFVKTVVQYKEEINRQSKLLGIISKPQIKLQRIDLQQQHVCKKEEVLANQQLSDQTRSSSLDHEEPEAPQMKEEQEDLCIRIDLHQQHVCKEEEVLTDQQLCDQKRSSSLDQEEPEPPRIKEEQEDLCISQEGQQFELKQETDTLMVTPCKEESDHSKPEPNSEHPLSPIAPVSESEDQQGSEHEDSVENHTMSESQCESATGKNAVECDFCGKEFEFQSILIRHLRTHTGEKPYSCKTCGRKFTNVSNLNSHMRIHTGEKPYYCKTCGKNFSTGSGLTYHKRTHTGEKPFLCKTCGKSFSSRGYWVKHVRTHTGETPYSCTTCGKNFISNLGLQYHMRTHTGEKPFSCKTCGKKFTQRGDLTKHIRTHTGEKPYCCKTCGKIFTQSGDLTKHVRIHTGEKPYSCKTCGKNFTTSGGVTYHMKTHPHCALKEYSNPHN